MVARTHSLSVILPWKAWHGARPDAAEAASDVANPRVVSSQALVGAVAAVANFLILGRVFVARAKWVRDKP